MSRERDGSPPADVVDLVLIYGIGFTVLRAFGFPEATGPKWLLFIVFAIVFGTAFWLRRRLGLGPDPKGRTRGMFGATIATVGIAALLVGGTRLRASFEEPVAVRLEPFEQAIEDMAGLDALDGFYAHALEVARTRAAECEARGEEAAQCRASAGLDVFEDRARERQDASRTRHARSAAKLAALEAAAEVQPLRDRVLGSVASGIGVVLLAALWWTERRLRR